MRYTVGVMTPSSFYPLCWPPLNQPLTRVPVPLLLNSLRLTMHWLPDMRCCNFDPPCHVLQIPLNLPLIWVPVPLLLNLLWLTTHWPPDTKCRSVFSPFQVLLNPPLTWMPVPLLMNLVRLTIHWQMNMSWIWDVASFIYLVRSCRSLSMHLWLGCRYLCYGIYYGWQYMGYGTRSVTVFIHLVRSLSTYLRLGCWWIGRQWIDCRTESPAISISPVR